MFRGPTDPTAYSGQRKADAIVSYMVKQSLPAVSILADAAKHDEFAKSDNVVLVAYVDADDSESSASFAAVAESLRDNYLFGTTSNAELAKAAGVKAPALVLYKSFDEGKDIYDGKFAVEDITAFAKASATPLVGEVGPDTYSGYMEAGIPLLYLFVDNDADKERLVGAVKPLAQKLKGKLNFATIDAAAYGAHAANLNLEQKWPAVAIQEVAKNQKFPFSQDLEITDASLVKFVEEFTAGKLSPSIKSEEVPETQEGPVFTVVAHNYEDIVKQEDKDVLVEFYAPWCGHCKNLAPKYEELGALYFNDVDFAKKVVIAKVDATANDVPVEIQGFPTIKLFPAGKKDSPVDYQGSRTVEDLAKFIKEHGTHKVDAYVAPEPEVVEEKEAEEAAVPVAEKVEQAAEKVAEATEKVAEKASEKAAEASEKVAEASEKVKSAAGTEEVCFHLSFG